MNDRFPYETKDERPGGPARTPIPGATVVTDGSRPDTTKRVLRAFVDFLPSVGYACLRFLEIAVTAIVVIALFAFFILGFVCTVR